MIKRCDSPLGGAGLSPASKVILSPKLKRRDVCQHRLRYASRLNRIALKQRHGSIVNVAAKAAFDHGAGAAAYAASKAAAVALMDSLAADTIGTGIRVNSILPSIIDTAANRHAMPDADFASWPKPEDIARVILFLCSDAAKTIHGASIPVYGNN